MHTNVNEFQFMEAFKDMNRLDNFSPAGLRALFAYLEEMEDDTGEPMELDVIAICCDYSEEPLHEVLENYGLESMEDLEDRTLVVAYGFDHGDDWVLYQNF